jgi:general secretion pathway protein L
MATTLGIDIGARTIRAALIRTSLRSLAVERYLEVEIPALSAQAPRDELLQAALRDLVGQLPEPPDSIVSVIDGARVSLRNVQLPLATKKRVSEVLPFELDPLLPFPIDEAVIDFQEVGPSATPGEFTVLAAAAPELAIEQALIPFTLAQLPPRELAVGAAALDGLLAFVSMGEPGSATMLLHFDHNFCDVCIVRNKACELARTLSEGVDAALARPPLFRAALLQTVMKYRADGGPQPERVLVMGVGADEPQLLQRVSDAMALPAESITLPSPSNLDAIPSALFGRALALAGRTTRRGKRLDLRRGKFAPERNISMLRNYALLAAGCLVAIILSYTFSVWAEYRALSEERDALAEKLAKVSELHFGESTRSATRARELLEGSGQARDPLPRFDCFRALGAISAAIPDTIVHDTRKLEITLDEGGQTGSFTIQGSLPDLVARDAVADALDAHDCIEQVERQKTSSMPGQDKKNYTLEGVIACPGAKKATKGKKK